MAVEVWASGAGIYGTRLIGLMRASGLGFVLHFFSSALKQSPIDLALCQGREFEGRSGQNLGTRKLSRQPAEPNID